MAVCGVVPVAAIVPIFPAGAYRYHGGIFAVLGSTGQCMHLLPVLLVFYVFNA